MGTLLRVQYFKYILSHFPSGRARTSLIRPSVRLSVCPFALLVWFSSTFLLRMENGFVPRAEGPYDDEGRNFVSRAEGPWFVGAGRRLFVDICTIESGRDPTNYYSLPLPVEEPAPH